MGQAVKNLFILIFAIFAMVACNTSTPISPNPFGGFDGQVEDAEDPGVDEPELINEEEVPEENEAEQDAGTEVGDTKLGAPLEEELPSNAPAPGTLMPTDHPPNQIPIAQAPVGGPCTGVFQIHLNPIYPWPDAEIDLTYLQRYLKFFFYPQGDAYPTDEDGVVYSPYLMLKQMDAEGRITLTLQFVSNQQECVYGPYQIQLEMKVVDHQSTVVAASEKTSVDFTEENNVGFTMTRDMGNLPLCVLDESLSLNCDEQSQTMPVIKAPVESQPSNPWVAPKWK